MTSPESRLSTRGKKKIVENILSGACAGESAKHDYEITARAGGTFPLVGMFCSLAATGSGLATTSPIRPNRRSYGVAVASGAVFALVSWAPVVPAQ
jgi:hypothetical protein